MDNTFGKTTYPFAVGRISAMWDTLLSKEQWSRLEQLRGAEIVRLLGEFGYGNGAKERTLDALCEAQLLEVKRLMAEIAPDEALTNLFFAEYDAHNIKTILKSRLINADVTNLLSPLGTFDTEIIRVCVSADEYSMLGKAFESLSMLENVTEPQAISAAVDNAVYAYIFDVLKKHRCPLLYEYFSLKAAYTNALTVLRAGRIGLSQAAADRMMISVEKSVVALRDESVDALASRMAEVLEKLLNESKNDPFGIGALVCYIDRRMNEVKRLRLIAASAR